MNQTVNTFTAGINQDLAKTVYKEGNYLDGLNITLLTDNGLSTAVVQNKKGTKLQIQFPATIPAATYEFNGEYPQVVPAQENLKVIEGIAITEGDNTERLFFFTKSNTVGNLNDNGYGQIWRCNFLGTTDNISGAINGYELTVNGHMMYNRNLNFKNVQRIKAIGKYENQNFSRIYWTDGAINPVRSINTIGPLTTVIQTPIRTLDIVSECNLDVPIIKRLIKGELPEGKYQLAYRLLSKSGDLTNFSTCSNLIDVIEGDEFNSEFGYPLSDTIEYSTDSIATTDTKDVIDSNKGIEFYIPHIDKDYQMIQYALIYYSQPNLPEIYVYPYKEISLYENQNESFTDLYSDTTIITTEEFNIMYAPFEKAKTIEVKDNILFAANTTNDMFKVNVDYRAYRYNASGQATTYELDGTNNTFSTVYPNNNLLDVINPYNDESGKIFGLNPNGSTSDWFNSQQYKFQQNGVTLGGQGPNISYSFGTTQILVDTNQLNINKAPLIKTEVDNSNLIGSVSNHVTNNNGSFSSLKSPYKSSCQVSWQRGEVYRFGITFYNKKGQASYVNWIGDIKMPDFNEAANAVSLLSTFNNNRLTMYSTHINFDVTIPQDLTEDISGFKIVYVERQENDKTRFGTAITGGMQSFGRIKVGTFFNNNNPTLNSRHVNSIIATIICYKIGNYIDEIDGDMDLFDIKADIRLRIMKTAASAIAKKLDGMPVAAAQRVVSSEDLADFVDSVLDGATNNKGGFIGISIGNIFKLIPATLVEKIKESIKEDLRKVLSNKVAGLHPNVYGLGQKGLAHSQISASSGLAAVGYTISPIVDFNKYNFKQGDFLKPINIFRNNNKVIYELHRDSSVGLYNVLDSSAYLRKWYRGGTIPWNQTSDSEQRRIYINNQKILIPGELLGSGFDNVLTSSNTNGGTIDYLISNSYISSIPQVNKRGDILNYTNLNLSDVRNAVVEGFDNAGVQYVEATGASAIDFIQKSLRPHTALGIGDKKHMIITNATFGNNGVPIEPEFTPINYYENESYLEQLRSPFYQSQESLRQVDYAGDYTVAYCRPISINQYGGVGYSSRSNNEYIAASEIYSLIGRVGNKSFSVRANLGDTYLGVYDAVNYCYYYNQVRPLGYQDPIRTKKGNV